MAPAAKLSQTRLLKTPRKASTSSPSLSAKTKSKTKSKPNQSILSFFKKTDGPAVQDEELFIGGVVEVEDGTKEKEGKGEGEDNDDIYAATPRASKEEERHNEVEGAVKRRRLSPASESGSSSENGQEGASNDSGTGSSDKVKKTEEPSKPAPKRKKIGNPFLDDESSSDDDDNESTPTPATARVRSPKSASDRDDSEPHHRLGPARLTSEAGISREAPLLQQTDLVNNPDESKDELLLLNDDGTGDVDLNDFEDDDFTGEELRAMQYMEEQARLEAEAEGEEYIGNDDGGEDGESMAEACPICNGSLAGATTEQATAHVNSCLDGDPTPLPRPPDSKVVDGAELGKRFAKAAVPRPGQANPISLGDGAGEGSVNSAFSRLMSGHAEDTAWATAAAAENASRGMPAYKRTCPFYKIMPGFSICVDAFRYGAVEGCRAYFLSHFHSDHYIGLTANWTHGPIYCSKVTGSLVKTQLKTAAKYVVELEFEETVPVPDTNGVTVTMIPANHCPGSSLFLFEKSIGSGGKKQRILHCGDFRACPAHIEHPQLRPETVDAISGKTKQQKIDVCYLDTTYLNPRYSFPPQRDVTSACAELCALLNKSLLANDNSKWEALLRGKGRSLASTESVAKFFTTTYTSPPSNQSNPSPPTAPPNAFTALNPRIPSPNRNRLLVVCGTYSIGKERICIAIAHALQTKIYAPPAKLRICAQLDNPDLTSLLTSNPRAAQVHMQTLAELRADTLAEYLDRYRGEFGRVIGFRPSGWTYRPSGPGKVDVKTAAKLAPAAVPTTQFLHGDGWRARFGFRDMVPVRGGTAEALCFGVPYSEHSSFRELGMFVMALRIERVVPTVGVGSESGRRRMKGWVERWVAERRRGGLVRVVEEGKDGKGDGGGLLWEGKDGKGGGVYW